MRFPIRVVWLVAIGALIAIFGYLFMLAKQAADTETAMSHVYNAAALAGQPAIARGAHARAALRSMVSSGVMPLSSALAAVQIIYTMPMLSPQSRERLATLAPVLYLQNNRDDKALARYLAEFGTMGGLLSLISTSGLATTAQAPAIAAAERNYDMAALQAIVLGPLIQRFSTTGRGSGKSLVSP